MIASQRVADIPDYYFARKLSEVNALQREGRPIINLGIGSPDLSPSIDVVSQLADSLHNEGSYRYQPYRGRNTLRDAMGAWYQRMYDVSLDPDHEILPLLGSKEGVAFLSLAYLGPGDIALLPDPGYPSYAAASTIAGAEVVRVDLKPENNWYPDLKAVARHIDARCKVMWINYPNMPTAQPASLAVFADLVAFAREHNILLCHDNPYSHILTDRPLSIFNVAGARDVAIELNSLSKSHNLAGARVGMMIGAKSLIDPVFRVKSNFDSGMFGPLQDGAIRALELGPSWYVQLNAEYSERRELARDLVSALACTWSEEANGLYVWARVPEHWGDGDELSDRLLYESDVFITPGSAFGNNGKQYLRVSLTSNREDLREAIHRITAFNHKYDT